MNDKAIKRPSHAEILQLWIDLSQAPESPEKTASIEALIKVSRERIERPVDIVILIEGGMLRSVSADVEDGNVILIDRDNESAGDEMEDFEEVTTGLSALW